MSSEMIMHYLSSKITAMLGMLLALPSGILAVLQGEIVPLMLSVAGGVLAFLWACRKFPIEDQLKNAQKVLRENLDLQMRNAKLAEENERLRVQNAYLEEDSKQIHVHRDKEA